MNPVQAYVSFLCIHSNRKRAQVQVCRFRAPSERKSEFSSGVLAGQSVVAWLSFTIQKSLLLLSILLSLLQFHISWDLGFLCLHSLSVFLCTVILGLVWILQLIFSVQCGVLCFSCPALRCFPIDVLQRSEIKTITYVWKPESLLPDLHSCICTLPGAPLSMSCRRDYYS